LLFLVKLSGMIFYSILISSFCLIVGSAYYTYLQYQEEKHSRKLFFIAVFAAAVGAISTIISHNDSVRNEQLAEKNVKLGRERDSLNKALQIRNLAATEEVGKSSGHIIDSLEKALVLSMQIRGSSDSISSKQLEARTMLLQQIETAGQTNDQTLRALAELERQNSPLREVGLSFTITYPMGNHVKTIDSMVDALVDASLKKTMVWRTLKQTINGKARVRKSYTEEAGGLIITKDTVFGVVQNKKVFLPVNDYQKTDGLHRYLHNFPKTLVRFYKEDPSDELFLDNDEQSAIMTTESKMITSKNFADFDYIEFDLTDKTIRQYMRIRLNRKKVHNSIFSIIDLKNAYMSFMVSQDLGNGKISDLQFLYGDSYSNFRPITDDEFITSTNFANGFSRVYQWK